MNWLWKITKVSFYVNYKNDQDNILLRRILMFSAQSVCQKMKSLGPEIKIESRINGNLSLMVINPK